MSMVPPPVPPMMLDYASRYDPPPTRIKVMAIVGLVFAAFTGISAVGSLVSSILGLFLDSGFGQVISNEFASSMRILSIANLFWSVIGLVTTAYLIICCIGLICLKSWSMKHYRLWAVLFIVVAVLNSISNTVFSNYFQQSIFNAPSNNAAASVPQVLFWVQLLVILIGTLVICIYPIVGLCLIRGHDVRRHLVG
jgi:hypothetical protein